MRKRWIAFFLVLALSIPSELALVSVPQYLRSDRVAHERLQKAEGIIAAAGFLVKPYNYDYAPQSIYVVENLTLLMKAAKLLNQTVIYESDGWRVFLSSSTAPLLGFVIKSFKCEPNQIAELLGKCDKPTLVTQISYTIPSSDLIDFTLLVFVTFIFSLGAAILSCIGLVRAYDDWKYVKSKEEKCMVPQETMR